VNITKDERTLFKGKPNGSPTIKDGKIVAPNLFKMSAKDLQKWQRKVGRELRSYCLSVDRSPVHSEYSRINHFICSTRREIYLTDKDFIEYIKTKRGIGKDIVIDSVALCCGEPGPGHKIHVEYY
jgi:hypothetical protein